MFRLFFLFLMLGCTRDQATRIPQAQLEAYIAKSFAVRSLADRSVLASYLTSRVKERLEAWSDAQFEEVFVGSKRELLRLLIKEVKKISPEELEITYELSFLEHRKRNEEQLQEARIINKKLCRMLFQDGKWLIADVKSLKELIEYDGGMALP
jgi:hypothetical protein